MCNLAVGNEHHFIPHYQAMAPLREQFSWLSSSGSYSLQKFIKRQVDLEGVVNLGCKAFERLCEHLCFSHATVPTACNLNPHTTHTLSATLRTTSLLGGCTETGRRRFLLTHHSTPHHTPQPTWVSNPANYSTSTLSSTHVHAIHTTTPHPHSPQQWVPTPTPRHFYNHPPTSSTPGTNEIGLQLRVHFVFTRRLQCCGIGVP